MKAFTDIEQSKKLAEILPAESADQTWERIAIAGANLHVPEEMEYWHNGNTPCILNSKIGIPCWSLAALLEVMPKQLGGYTLTFYWCDDSWCCSYIDDGSEIKETSSANNPVDATVEMIIKLKEKDLI